jgi:hypothetical protein
VSWVAGYCLLLKNLAGASCALLDALEAMSIVCRSGTHVSVFVPRAPGGQQALHCFC